MQRTDTTALVVGLIAVLIAGLGLWHAFGTIPWQSMGVLFPIVLVLVGIVGLASTRQRT